MINACFDREKNAAIAGAYQYDTGQRLAMYGLPAPKELTGRDELLSGEMVTVQAHFGYDGDSQTEGTLARYDAARGAWLASVPDEYLARSEPVHVYVHMYFGSDEAQGERTKTMYEGVFRPAGRPAPGGVVTQEQLDTWAAVLEEVTMRLAAAEAAALSAKAAGEEAAASAAQISSAALSAKEAAESAQEARDALEALGTRLDGMRVVVEQAAPQEEAKAEISGADDAWTLTCRIPRGADGEKGETGDKGPSDLAFALDGTTLYVTRT